MAPSCMTGVPPHMIWALLGLGIVLLLALLYWQIIIAEGAYLGPKIVTVLYDWGAASYDRIKNVDPVDEAIYLAHPLLSRISDVRSPWILDVATGTGRLPLAVVQQLDFSGRVVGLDLSAKMLQQARRKLALFRSRVTLIQQAAGKLPFRDGAFDAVTCLEALEFMPNPPQVVAEMVRVLRPGGLLLITNRVGWEAHLLQGRACGRGQMEGVLASLPVRDVRTERWQVYYDLIWARKEERGEP